jgi:malonate-semialdehyde dehydrogenase (acetylating)/methylmalonate-semialdehyde dehydrogenase
MSQNLLFKILDEIDFPPGVVNLVNGDKRVVDALLEHPDMVGVSFIGSTAVRKYLYAEAAQHGKRAQVQAGAKNCLVVMPDAVLEKTIPSIMTSSFGTSGQRCLSGSLVVAVGDIYEPLRDGIIEAASRIKVGYGLDESVQMGPVVSKKSLNRILGYIDKGMEE